MRKLARISSDVPPLPKRQNRYAFSILRKSLLRNYFTKVKLPKRVGYEPRRLFNVVEFLMNDKDDSGSVSVEEAMQILYLRFGKGLLDSVGTGLLFRFQSPKTS